MADKPQGFFEGTEMPTAGWWEALFPDPAGLLGTVDVRTGATVIDLCSGDGWFTAQLARIAQQVTAIDIDGQMLDVARARLAERGLTNLTFVKGNAYDVVRLVPQPVDFVFLANALHGVPDRLGADEDKARFEKKLGKIAKLKPADHRKVRGRP